MDLSPSPNPTVLREPRRIAGLSLTGAVSLISVVCVLVLVSLPRLRTFILIENAEDAKTTVRYLASESALIEGQADPRVGTLLEQSRKLRHALSDAEVLEDGRLLRRHGYLFAFVPVGEIDRSGEVEDDPNRVQPLEAIATLPETGHFLLAWPWRAEESPLVLGTLEGELYSPLRSDPAWSGPELDPLTLPPLERWRPVDL